MPFKDYVYLFLWLVHRGTYLQCFDTIGWVLDCLGIHSVISPASADHKG